MNNSSDPYRKVKRSRQARRTASEPRVRGLRASFESLEARTLLATYVWTNPAGGDWDTASNWVNQADSSNHQVPTGADDAQINMSNITVTHATSASDAVNSLTSSATLSISNGSLTVATTSSISGGLTLSGGTLAGAGTINVSGPTNWSGGTMSGSGITSAKGGLTLGGTAATTYYAMYLDQRTFNNSGAAQFRSSSSAGGYYTNLYLSSGALFDNTSTGSLIFTSDYTNFQSNGGTPSGGTFQNDGSLTKQGTSGSSAIGSGITFNDIGSASLSVSSGTLLAQGRDDLFEQHCPGRCGRLARLRRRNFRGLLGDQGLRRRGRELLRRHCQ